MTKDQAIKIMRETLDNNNLHDWTGTVNTRAKTRLGQYRYGKKNINISSFRLKDDDEQIMNTIFHEVAHAICGYESGHNSKWRYVCIKLGGNGTRTNNSENTPKSRYVINCECGLIHRAHRMTNSMREGIQFCLCKKHLPRGHEDKYLDWSHNYVDITNK